MMIYESLSIAESRPIAQQPSVIVTSQSEMRTLRLRVLRQLSGILLKKLKNPVRALRLIIKIRKKYQTTFGEAFLQKASKVENRYYWRLGTPGYPSAASKIMHRNEVERLFPGQRQMGLRTIIFAITKKCPLKCEHCFEWDNLGQKESLSTADIIRIVHEYQDYGTTQIMFSGGEPMLRIQDIYQVLGAARPGTDFWIITSGLGLDKETALKLKTAGLTGIMVSIDHHDEKHHDHFRGVMGAYDHAVQAVCNANSAGLVTALSLCATKNYVTEGNLRSYMDFAKKLGVTFVQILDPRAAGRYHGKEVELGKMEIGILENIYQEYNSLPELLDFPIINYLGYHQRRTGCFGSGNRFFYIDTDGDAHICPYCVKKIISTATHSPFEVITSLNHSKCHLFRAAGHNL